MGEGKRTDFEEGGSVRVDSDERGHGRAVDVVGRGENGVLAQLIDVDAHIAKA